MPTLHWIGKDKVINHHLDVPFKSLEHSYGFNNGIQTEKETNSGNKIIHGDNLEALKSLLPEYEGSIDCIYIDPPYNTGKEGWVYNDNVNDPKIKKWLGEVVGKESEDLTRHDKWLCMMYPRMKLLHKLLSNDGVILISIDDNEQANLKLICDEIFGYTNCIGPIIQNKMNAKNDTINVQKNHEFIIMYRKRALNIKGTKVKPSIINEKLISKEVTKENDEYYYLNDAITTRGEGGVLNERTNLGYTVYYNPNTIDKIAVCDYDVELAKTSNIESDLYKLDDDLISKGYITIRAPKVRGKLGCWTWSLDKFNKQKKNIIITGKKNSYSVKKRTFVDKKNVFEENGKFYIQMLSFGNSRSIINYSTNDGTTELNNIMGVASVFDNPKNINMLEYLISLIPNKNATILDSFAGSGSTAQAVLSLNKKDNGNRRFICIEMMDYAETITAERTKRVISGYSYIGNKKDVIASFPINVTTLKKSDKILVEYNQLKQEGTYKEVKIESANNEIQITGTKEIKGKIDPLTGSFDFYTLGEPMFIEDGNLNESVNDDQIRKYIYYTETRSALIKSAHNDNKYFLNVFNNTGYYFNYEKEKETTLNYDFLATMVTKAELYVIYADNCLLSKEFMTKNNIIFKKIPRDITRF
jgi:adenine-specific DNA-methyltransferase